MATTRRNTASDFTVRLPIVIKDRLKSLAEGERRSVADYIESLVEKEALRHAEEERVIRVHVAPGASGPTGDILREDDEEDGDYARRASIARALFGIADRDDTP